MVDFPRSLIEFQCRFLDERACAEYLARVRWLDGFCLPSAVAKMPTTYNMLITPEATA